MYIHHFTLCEKGEEHNIPPIFKHGGSIRGKIYKNHLQLLHLKHPSKWTYGEEGGNILGVPTYEGDTSFHGSGATTQGGGTTMHSNIKYVHKEMNENQKM